MVSSFITLLLFIAFFLNDFNSLIDSLSDMGMPDKLFYYDAQTLKQIALAYGKTGRAVYVRCAFTYDLAWPIMYISFLIITISWCNNVSFTPDSRIKRLNMVPLICALFDALENSALSLVMLTFPATREIWFNLPGLFTLCKWIFVGLSFSILGFSFIHAIQHGVRRYLEKS